MNSPRPVQAGLKRQSAELLHRHPRVALHPLLACDAHQVLPDLLARSALPLPRLLERHQVEIVPGPQLSGDGFFEAQVTEQEMEHPRAGQATAHLDDNQGAAQSHDPTRLLQERQIVRPHEREAKDRNIDPASLDRQLRQICLDHEVLVLEQVHRKDLLRTTRLREALELLLKPALAATQVGYFLASAPFPQQVNYHLHRVARPLAHLASVALVVEGQLIRLLAEVLLGFLAGVCVEVLVEEPELSGLETLVGEVDGGLALVGGFAVLLAPGEGHDKFNRAAPCSMKQQLLSVKRALLFIAYLQEANLSFDDALTRCHLKATLLFEKPLALHERTLALATNFLSQFAEKPEPSSRMHEPSPCSGLSRTPKTKQQQRARAQSASTAKEQRLRLSQLCNSRVVSRKSKLGEAISTSNGSHSDSAKRVQIPSGKKECLCDSIKVRQQDARFRKEESMPAPSPQQTKHLAFNPTPQESASKVATQTTVQNHELRTQARTRVRADSKVEAKAQKRKALSPVEIINRADFPPKKTTQPSPPPPKAPTGGEKQSKPRQEQREQGSSKRRKGIVSVLQSINSSNSSNRSENELLHRCKKLKKQEQQKGNKGKQTEHIYQFYASLIQQGKSPYYPPESSQQVPGTAPGARPSVPGPIAIPESEPAQSAKAPSSRKPSAVQKKRQGRQAKQEKKGAASFASSSQEQFRAKLSKYMTCKPPESTRADLKVGDKAPPILAKQQPNRVSLDISCVPVKRQLFPDSAPEANPKLTQIKPFDLAKSQRENILQPKSQSQATPRTTEGAGEAKQEAVSVQLELSPQVQECVQVQVQVQVDELSIFQDYEQPEGLDRAVEPIAEANASEEESNGAGEGEVILSGLIQRVETLIERLGCGR